MQNTLFPQRYYLFFDTETTGLPTNYADFRTYPNLVSLAWALLPDNCRRIEEPTINYHIIRPDGWQIPAEAVSVHNITQNIAEQEGNHITEVLDLFFQDVTRATHLVGHNVDFDFGVMLKAAYGYMKTPELLIRKPKICTMKSTTEITMIPGRYGWKWATLKELHIHLFNEYFQNAHNSRGDVLATIKCFFELQKRGVIL